MVDYATLIHVLTSSLPKPEITKEIEDSEFIKSLWQKLYSDNGTTAMFHGIYSITLTVNISGDFAGGIIDAVIDTGAQMNVIPLDTIENLGLQRYVDTNVDGYTKGVNGTSKLMGIIPYLEMYINGYVFPICALVAPKGSSMLLGLPFLSHYDAKIDFSANKLSLKGQDFPIKISEK